MFYSKSTGGFYHQDIHANFPPDVVEITDAYHSELMAAQSNGKRITADENGRPVAADPLPPTAAQLWAAHQAAAAAELEKTDLVAIRCIKAGVAFPAEWKTYCDDLRAIVRTASGDPAVTPLPVRPAYPTGT